LYHLKKSLIKGSISGGEGGIKGHPEIATP